MLTYEHTRVRTVQGNNEKIMIKYTYKMAAGPFAPQCTFGAQASAKFDPEGCALK